MFTIDFCLNHFYSHVIINFITMGVLIMHTFSHNDIFCTHFHKCFFYCITFCLYKSIQQIRILYRNITISIRISNINVLSITKWLDRQMYITLV